MKKIRFRLHIFFIITLIMSIMTGMYVVFDDNTYMTKEQQNHNYATEFNTDVSTILENVGTIAEFNDRYGSDTIVVEGSGGKTVGELKTLCDNDSQMQKKFKEYLTHLFYYHEYDFNSEAGFYDENNTERFYFDKSYVAKYGCSSREELEKKVEYYSALSAFANEYSNYKYLKDKLNSSNVSNLHYYIKYTDVDSEESLIEYASDSGRNILGNPNVYKEYFLFDKSSNTQLLKNLDKDSVQFDSLVFKCKTFTDYKDFYAVFGIDSTYFYNDQYSFLTNGVISDNYSRMIHYGVYLVFYALLLTLTILFVLQILYEGRNEKEHKKYEISIADTLWWDVTGTAILMLLGIVYNVIKNMRVSDVYDITTYIYYGIISFVCIEIFSLYTLSQVRKLKVHKFWHYSCVGFLYRRLKKWIKLFTENTSTTFCCFCAALLTIAYVCLMCRLFVNAFIEKSYLHVFLWFTMLIIVIGLIVLIALRYFSEYSKIIHEVEILMEDETPAYIEMEAAFPQNKRMINAINTIGDSINKAVADNVKNERLKSDLITNVSHDIKTPLTSIINYVNLLKMANVCNEEAQKYIDILEEKSHRLKNLTDDLVEASKLSSGVIKLEKEKVNLVALIQQSAGEFEEKFLEKRLDVVMELPMYPVFIMADGRKIWRVLENLYGNIFKYALEGTRVYIDLKLVKDIVILSVKNISSNTLHIDSDDLSERFIRGDVSRTTEGSGLGLSIAKSIIDRHDGEFKIILDGDLFKVNIKLDAYVE